MLPNTKHEKVAEKVPVKVFSVAQELQQFGLVLLGNWGAASYHAPLPGFFIGLISG